MKKFILIIEDNPLNVKLMRDLLQAKGYKTKEVETAEEGIDAARKEKPDLIIMDIELPGMSGLEATRILKSGTVTKNIPVVAVTAYAMKGDREKALAAGCDNYISKPVEIKDLLNQVQLYLGQ